MEARRLMEMATMNPESQTKNMRVVVANEPLSYREVISGALDGLRPEVEITTVASEEMDAAVLRLRPRVVICSRVSAVVEEHVLVWAELYPDGSALSEVSFLNERSSVEDMQLEDLFDLLDRAAAFVCRD